MSPNGQPAIIELGSKVSVRRNGQNRIGIVTSLAGEYVTVRWTNLDFSEIAGYQARRDDVTPLADGCEDMSAQHGRQSCEARKL
jgi:hypothetical protein